MESSPDTNPDIASSMRSNIVLVKNLDRISSMHVDVVMDMLSDLAPVYVGV